MEAFWKLVRVANRARIVKEAKVVKDQRARNFLVEFITI